MRPFRNGLCPRLTAAALAAGAALAISAGAPAADELSRTVTDELPAIRRIFVPAEDEFWPPGDWEPVILSEFQQQFAAARAARRPRPAAFIERAEYSATLVEDELKEARLEWTVRRQDPTARILSLGRLNLNVSGLDWSAEGGGRPLAAAVWGALSAGTSVVVVNRPEGRLVADWSLTGRKLTASTEFDAELAPAAVSQMRLRVPTGLVLTTTAGRLSGPTAAAEPGWDEWRIDLGSQTGCRLRIAPPPDPHGNRPLILVRSNLNYDVRSEAVRVQADFTMNVLESGVREFRLFVDPEVQVTAVEYGDDGAVDWQSLATTAGQEIVVRLPDAVAGEGHTLKVQGIAQVKPFAAWTLPRIRLQNSIEAAGRATLRLPAPFLAADIRTDGYRQVELTSGGDDEEVLVFRRIREDGTITVVPADSKPDLTCRAVTLIEPDGNQWSMTSEWDWKASSGSTFTASFAISGRWEIVDVRLPSGGRARELTGWEVQETDPDRRILHLSFLNALKADRLHRVRISARRLPPAADAPAIVPPLIPLDASDVEQLLVVATGSEWRPVVTGASAIETVDIRDFAEATNGLDFLNPILSDSRRRFAAFRALGALAESELRVERVDRLPEPDRNSSPPSDEKHEATQPKSPSTDTGDGPGSPVSLELEVQVSGTSSGFDHYVATCRLTRLVEGVTFRWNLPRSAEVIGVNLDGLRVVPAAQGTSYSITAPVRKSTDENSAAKVSTLAIEYRTPTTLHFGPNWRAVVIPQWDRPVMHFDLALRSSDGLRLDGQPPGLTLTGGDEQLPWRRRLLGSFSRGDGQSIFNPFRRVSWATLLTVGGNAGKVPKTEQLWHGADAAPPADLTIVIWSATEVTWLSWVVLFACLLAGSLARLVQAPWRCGVAMALVPLLAFLALALPPVTAELSGSALTGLLLVVLLPRRLIHPARRVAPRDSAGVPMGSTQSFVPIAVVMLTIMGLGMSVAVRAEGPKTTPPSSPSPRAAKQRPAVVDILIPAGPDGRSGESPVAYIPTDFAKRLKQMTRPVEMPPYLLAETTYDGSIDESNRLEITARFVVQVLSGESVVPVELPLGLVNLGGQDACRVDGTPHPVVAGSDGRGLIIELPGADPLASTPATPEDGTPSEGLQGGGAKVNTVRGEPFPLRTATIELHLYPAVDAGRGGVFSGTLTVPRGSQTFAAFSSPNARPLMRISTETAVPVGTAKVPHVAIRPGPANQLVFFWSGSGETPSRPPAEVQVGISCLADVSPTLIQMRHHLAYRVQAGQVESLVWYVPAGCVLESVQAPHLAGYRFETVANGARRMLIEFSRPQTGDFSLAATFAIAVDRFEKQMSLPLLDPLRAEDGTKSQLGLRYHQFALRQPSDFLAGVLPAESGQPLKPRSVDDFLKEWNAAGPRPQSAFDVEGVFTVNIVLDPQPSVPVVRGSSIGRFHPGRLDWIYTAEVAQPPVPQFLYRLHVDPRLRIRSVSVQEDGAERLLRRTQLRDTVVLFLNDRATRAQTVRLETSLATAVSQVIGLPRIRFAGATPGSERITLYRDADVAVSLANPEDFPQPETVGSGPDPRGDWLVGRIDALPEQSNLRVAIEPVLPVVSAEVATVFESSGDRWQFTTGVEFQVASGRVNDFTMEIPESLAARIDTRSIPASHVSRHPAVDGRVALSFHPDEPALRRFVGIFAGAVDTSEPEWSPPEVRLPGADCTATMVFTPRGLMEPDVAVNAGDMSVIPEWTAELAPTTTNTSLWNSYRWTGTVPAAVQFHATRDRLSRTIADDARIELWLGRDGSVRGWLSMTLVGNLGAPIDLDWPGTAHPTVFFAGGAFQLLPVSASGNCSLSVPRAAADRLVWISWTDTPKPLPVWSGTPRVQIPWPRHVPVVNCHVAVHLPEQYQADALASVSNAPRQKARVPPLFGQREARDTGRPGEVSLVALPVPESGKPLNLGDLIHVTNQAAVHFMIALAVALFAALASWKTARFWQWLPQQEWRAWMILAAFWWMFLEPSWLGAAIAVWACHSAIRRQTAPDFESPATSEVLETG